MLSGKQISRLSGKVMAFLENEAGTADICTRLFRFRRKQNWTTREKACLWWHSGG